MGRLLIPSAVTHTWVPLLAAALVALAPARAAGFCRTTTVQQTDPTRCAPRGVPIMWAGGCVGYRINPRLLPNGITLEQFREALRVGAQSWSSVICDARVQAPPSFELVPLPDLDVPVGYFKNEPNYNSIAFRDHWNDDEYHPASSAAITIVTFNRRSGLILDADTEFNLRHPNNPTGFIFRLAVVDDTAHLPTVLTHEFGHTLGLAHSGQRTAVMWYQAGLGERRDTLTLDDATGVCTVYPPGRLANCEPEPPAVHQFGGSGWHCDARPGERDTALYGALVALGCAAFTAWRRANRG